MGRVDSGRQACLKWAELTQADLTQGWVDPDSGNKMDRTMHGVRINSEIFVDADVLSFYPEAGFSTCQNLLLVTKYENDKRTGQVMHQSFVAPAPSGPRNSGAFNFSIFKALHCRAKFVVKSPLKAPAPGGRSLHLPAKE